MWFVLAPFVLVPCSAFRIGSRCHLKTKTECNLEVDNTRICEGDKLTTEYLQLQARKTPITEITSKYVTMKVSKDGKYHSGVVITLAFFPGKSGKKPLSYYTVDTKAMQKCGESEAAGKDLAEALVREWQATGDVYEKGDDCPEECRGCGGGHFCNDYCTVTADYLMDTLKKKGSPVELPEVKFKKTTCEIQKPMVMKIQSFVPCQGCVKGQLTSKTFERAEFIRDMDEFLSWAESRVNSLTYDNPNPEGIKLISKLSVRVKPNLWGQNKDYREVVFGPKSNFMNKVPLPCYVGMMKHLRDKFQKDQSKTKRPRSEDAWISHLRDYVKSLAEKLKIGQTKFPLNIEDASSHENCMDRFITNTGNTHVCLIFNSASHWPAGKCLWRYFLNPSTNVNLQVKPQQKTHYPDAGSCATEKDQKAYAEALLKKYGESC